MSSLFNAVGLRRAYRGLVNGDKLVSRAYQPFATIVDNIKPDQLDAATPCAEYDVRRLVNHMLFWGPSLEAAGRKETVPPPAESEADVDLTAADWAGDLVAQLNRTVAAWSRPEAWQGVASMGGPHEIPASMVGGMVLGELVIHGWDLAQATGQQATWDEDVLTFTFAEVAANAETGRQMGVYGPEVEVPADAPLLHRILGVTGRRPV